MSGCARRTAYALAASAVLASACATTPALDPRYAAPRSVLEVVAVLRRHVPDDTYRFPPARDFTGRNVYRATLIRLENLERVHADALRAGQLDDVIAFAKGRGLERLRAFSLAAQSYRRAAEQGGELAEEARRSAAICDAFAEAAALGPGAGASPGPPGVPEPESPAVVSAPPPGRAGPSPPVVAAATAPEQALRLYDRRVALLAALEPRVAHTHYSALLREEIERADEDRARFFVARRRTLPNGDVRALSELQRVATEHRESKFANRHLLALADLYAQLAEEYVDERPAEGLTFDPPAFQELVDSAARLYGSVANQDGSPEKLEAARRLEAFLAFTLGVDRDRFSP